MYKGSPNYGSVNKQYVGIHDLRCNNVEVHSEYLKQENKRVTNDYEQTDKELFLSNFENKNIFVTKENPSLGLTTKFI